MARPVISADLVLVNGVVLTMDATDQTVEAVAVRDERILAVGTSKEIEALVGSRTEVIDLQGRTAMPGVADIHVHLASDAARRANAAEARDFFDSDIRSIGDIQRVIVEQAEKTPPGQWVQAVGSPMQDFRLDEQRFPDRRDLDAASPRHPCYITFGAHILIANSLALRQRGVTRDTPDPQGGTVVKDASGEPNGILRERAQFLIRSRAAGLSPEQLAENVLVELQLCAQRGVTSIHDIVINRDEVRAYQLLERSGRLPVRVQLIPRVIESDFSKESLLDLGLLQGFGSDLLRLGGIKMSIDGGFTGKNAAFKEPLSVDGDDNPGLIRIDQSELDETVWRYHELGMRCCVHAIGDLALDMILEAYDKALTRLPRRDHRHRVEHLGNWMMDPDRIAWTKQLGVLPIANPSFLYFVGAEALETLGPKRSEQIFPFRTLLEAGFPLAWGSDSPGYWPVDSLRDLGATVSRKTFQGLELSPEQAIGIREALRAQTRTAAWVGFMEDRLGTLEPGKLADLIVLGENPFSFPSERFRELPVDRTIMNGRVVHSQ